MSIKKQTCLLIIVIIFLLTSCQTPMIWQNSEAPLSEVVVSEKIIRIYFYNDNDEQLYYEDKIFELPENATAEDIFSLVFNDAIFEGLLHTQFGDKYVLKYIKKEDRTVLIDFENTSEDSGPGAGAEYNLIESITNTLGYFYNFDYVKIYEGNSPFKGGHIEMPDEGFFVNYTAGIKQIENAAATVANKATINWEIVDYDRKEVHPYSDVYLVINSGKEEKVFIDTFQGFNLVSEGHGDNSNIPEGVVLYAMAWWAGGGDELYVYLKNENTLSVMGRFVDSQAEIPEFQELKEIKIESNLTFQKIQTVFKEGESKLYVKYKPIVYHSTLLGGSDGDEWVDAKTVAPHIKGEEPYFLYTMFDFAGEGTGSKAIQSDTLNDYSVEIKIDSNLAANSPSEYLAINTSMPLDLPRKPTKQDVNADVYVKYINGILRDNGFSGSSYAEVKILQNYKIDLDDDGQDEVIIYATNAGDSQYYKKGQYSVLVLRKIINGKVESIFLDQAYFSSVLTDEEFGKREINKFEIKQFACLNDDNKMEIIVGFQNYKGSGYTVYEIVGNNAIKVLSGGVNVNTQK